MKKKVLSLILGTVLLASVGVRPAYAAENIFQKFTQSLSSRLERVTLMLPGNKPGSAVMKQAAMASEKLKTAEMNTVMIVDLLKQDKSLANLKLTITGPFEVTDVYNPQTYKQSFAFSGEATMQGTTMRASGDVRMTNDMLYFKINEAPALPFFNFDQINGKWLKTENKKSEEKSNGNSSATLSPDQQAKMKQAYTDLIRKAEFSQAKKETKNGHKVFVVDAVFPKQAVLDYVKAVMEIAKENKGESSEDMTAANEASQKNVEKVMNNVGDIKATVWVDRSSYYVRHVELPLLYTLEKPAAGKAVTDTSNPFAGLQDAEQVRLSLIMDFDKFDQPVTFEEPKDAQDAQEVFQQMMGAQMPKNSQFGEGTSELPNLTPAQKAELQRLQKMNALQQEQQLKKMMQEAEKEQ